MEQTRPLYVVRHISTMLYISPEIYNDGRFECPKLTDDLQKAEVVNSSFLNNLLGTCNLYNPNTNTVIQLCERNDFEVYEVRSVTFEREIL